MSLINTDSSNGYIEATATDGYAESTAIAQDVADGDFSSVKNISAKYEFANISQSQISISYDFGTPDHTQMTTPYNDIVNVDNSNANLWKGFDRVTSATDSDMQSVKYSSGNIWEWYYSFDTPVEIVRFGFLTNSTTLKAYPRSFEIRASNDLVSETVVLSVTANSMSSYQTKYWLLSNTAVYKYYRFVMSESSNTTDYINLREIYFQIEVDNSDINTLITNEPIADGDNLVIIKEDNSIHETVAAGVTGAGPYQMDTTAITAGEVPLKAYKVNESLLFNNTLSAETGNTYSGTGPLLSTRTFSDVNITGRSLVTKVQMSATGNKCTEVSGDIWKSTS